MGTIAVRTFFLFLFWIFISGKLQAFYLVSGFLTALLLAYLSSKEKLLKLPIQGNFAVLRTFWHYVRYSLWLLTRIYLAAIHVTQVILDPKLPINPKLFEHKTDLKHDVERVIFANSITLTPGTITTNIDNNILLVHQLDDDSAGDIHSHAMENEIRKIHSS